MSQPLSALPTLKEATSVRSVKRASSKKSHAASQTTLSPLKHLFTGDHINASAGGHYSNKNFGRDTAVSMLFLTNTLRYRTDWYTQRETRSVIEPCIRSLVFWQGSRGPKRGDQWRKNAEERGKIHHEAGTVSVDLLDFVDKWRDEDDARSEMMVYFGSVDSTPLFVRLVSEYVRLLQERKVVDSEIHSFLLDKITNFRGEQLSIIEGALEAIEWVESRLERSELGFIEYYREPGQEDGLRNQVWKDSLTSYIHITGELANTDQPIASIEVQALAYDALMGLADIFELDQQLAKKTGIDQRQISGWRQKAQAIRQRIFKYFWITDQQRFAQAIDRDRKTGRPRRIETASSNQLHLLNSRLFDDLDQTIKKPYIESLVQQVMGDDFLTDAGVRCRARSLYKLVDFTDYHGSWSVWPWESHWIASGLRRQSLPVLADEVDKRVINAINTSSGYLEFYLVHPITNIAYYRFLSRSWKLTSKVLGQIFIATNIPDSPQAWTATAAIDIETLLSLVHSSNSARPEWLAQLEQNILSRIKRAELIINSHQLFKIRQVAPVAVVDTVAGKAADKRYYEIADRLKLSKV